MLFLLYAQHGQQLDGESPVVGLVVGTTSQGQGCPLWSGIWRKSEEKSRSEEHELHTRFTKVGWVCNTKQSPTLPKTLGVNVADIWDEGYGLRLEKPNISVY